MKRLFRAAFAIAVGALAWFSLPPAPQQGALTEGVVLSIDEHAGNVTISHGPMPDLGMPRMTMGFRAAEPALLETIKPGDKVRFHADVVGGTFTVMKIEAVK